MKNGKYLRKGLAFLTVLVLVASVFAGCGNNAAQDNTSASNTTETATSVQTDTKADETESDEPTETTLPSESTDEGANHADTLVVYFSATGHTEPLAKYAAEYLNADLYEIVPAVPYTDDDLDYGNSESRTSREQNDDSARPEIAGTLPDISTYDTVIIGHPIWWGQAPKIIYTFLENYDWTGKTLVTFCTSASSGLGSSAENLKLSASGNPNWLESRRFSIGAVRDEVTEWIDDCILQ